MSFRGGFYNSGRARNRGSLWGRGSTHKAEAPPAPLGPTLDNIDIKTLLIEEAAPKIADVEYVASYNWLGGKSPTILVPG